MKDLSFPTRDRTCVPPAAEAQTATYWATQEFPAIHILNVRQLCLTVAPPDTKSSSSSIKPLGQRPPRHHRVGCPQPLLPQPPCRSPHCPEPSLGPRRQKEPLQCPRQQPRGLRGSDGDIAAFPSIPVLGQEREWMLGGP